MLFRRVDIAGAQKMVLQVPADLRHFDLAVDAGIFQHVLRADTRAHQKRRRFQRTGAEQNRWCGEFGDALWADDFEVADGVAVHYDAADARAGQDGEVVTCPHIVGQPGIGDRDPLSVLDVHRVGRDADHLAVIMALQALETERHACFDKGVGEGARLLVGLVDQKGTGILGAVFSVLIGLKSRQQTFPAPSRVTGRFRPELVVVGVAAHVTHGV